MADDTRQPEEQVPPRPRGPANVMPGGTAHTAGGEKTDNQPNYIDAVRSLGPEYYLNFHKRPCVRDSQLQGLAAGFAGGSLAAILGSACIPVFTIWGGSRTNMIDRTCPYSVELGCWNMVLCFGRVISSLPVL